MTLAYLLALIALVLAIASRVPHAHRAAGWLLTAAVILLAVAYLLPGAGLDVHLVPAHR